MKDLEGGVMAHPRDADRDWISDEDDLGELYSAEYLRECAAGDARAERLAELRRRIEAHAYKVDAIDLAAALLSRASSDE
jgi:anti-sigma28 factor (negative regulator of flagellin synthesis)